jgi:hypothetical protein
MGYELGLPPDLAARFQTNVTGFPTPGFGYLIGDGDELSALLERAYGSGADPYSSAFASYNAHLGAGSFGDLSSMTGQLLYFPMFAELARMQMQTGAGASPTGFPAIDAFLAQAGMPSSAASMFMQDPNGAGVVQANPELELLIEQILTSGGAPGQERAVGGLINYLRTLLSDDIVRSGARDAIREGRTSQGRRGTRPSEEGVDRAMRESWTPRNDPVQNGVRPMSQLDYNEQLGNGGSSIRRAGCYLTAMTMASTRITGNMSLNPSVANDLVRRGGGFSGSSLVVDNAARSLGMRVLSRGAPSMSRLDQSLDAGRPVVAGVDYKAGSSSARSNADHFITITGRNADGSYSAIDPAGGRAITLHPTGDGRLRGQSGSKTYTVAEMTFLDAR